MLMNVKLQVSFISSHLFVKWFNNSIDETLDQFFFSLRLRQQGVGRWRTALHNVALQQRPRLHTSAEYTTGSWKRFHSGKRNPFSFSYARKVVYQCLLDRRMIEWRNRDRVRKSITYHSCSWNILPNTSDCLVLIPNHFLEYPEISRSMGARNFLILP